MIGQAGRHRDRLGQARRRAAADAHQDVDVVAGGRCAGPLGHLDRDVHHHVVVTQRHGDVLGDRVGQVHLGLGRDQHDPGGAEVGDLAAQVGRRRAGTEGDALWQGVVDEAHGLLLSATACSAGR